MKAVACGLGHVAVAPCCLVKSVPSIRTARCAAQLRSRNGGDRFRLALVFDAVETEFTWVIKRTVTLLTRTFSVQFAGNFAGSGEVTCQWGPKTVLHGIEIWAFCGTVDVKLLSEFSCHIPPSIGSIPRRRKKPDQ
jgi:hypothetical protein